MLGGAWVEWEGELGCIGLIKLFTCVELPNNKKYSIKKE